MEDIKSKLNINRDCSNIDYLPTITIKFPYKSTFESKERKDYTVTLLPEDYLINGKKIKYNKDNNIPFDSNEYKECHAAIMPINVPPPRGPIFVFGEYFMRKFYTVFDRDNYVIGFAESKKSNEIITNTINTPYDDNTNIKEKEEIKDQSEWRNNDSFTYENFLQLNSVSFLKQESLNLDII